MGVFAVLHAARSFRRRHLDFLQTREDLDLVVEIGFHQERGTPLTMKQLQLMGLTSVPTLQRRLRRLREEGAVLAKKSDADGRAIELVLSARLLRTYSRYAELLKTLELNGGDALAGAETA